MLIDSSGNVKEEVVRAGGLKCVDLTEQWPAGCQVVDPLAGKALNIPTFGIR